MPLIQVPEKRTAQYYPEILVAVHRGQTATIRLEMILIPGGSFLMGSPEDEPEREEVEGPQHWVTVPSFFMSRYPITQAQYQAIMGENPSDFKGDVGEASRNENRPVENVSWHEATAFCNHIAQQSDRPYRLPTEAEWEYACRSGTTTPFYFGSTITPDLANYDGNYTYNDGPEGEYREETTPVDYFGIANGFGLCDMHGNVWEWCQDHWHDTYEGAPPDGSAWIDPEASEDALRVLRGGSWYSNPRDCRSASRDFDDAGERFNSYGFRVVCVAPRT
jgi:formylglycine-generating enzyme required for sulfatase activity